MHSMVSSAFGIYYIIMYYTCYLDNVFPPKEAQYGLMRLNYHVCMASSLSAVQTGMWMVLAVFAVIRQEVCAQWSVYYHSTPFHFRGCPRTTVTAFYH